MSSVPLEYITMSGVYDSAVDYGNMVDWITLVNMQKLGEAGYEFQFSTTADESATVGAVDGFLSSLESWADGAFTVGDKDSRDLPVAFPQTALSSLCMMLPPPFNLVAVVVMQIGLKILDSKLEAASNRAATEEVVTALRDILECLQTAMLSVGGDDEYAPILARMLDVFGEIDLTNAGEFRRLHFGFGGITNEEVSTT